MIECDIIVFRGKMLRSLLHGLLLNGAHPLDLQFGAEGGGDVLKHHAQRIVEPCRREQKAQEKQEIQLSRKQQGRSCQDGGGKADAQKGLGGADESPGHQLRMDGAFFHGFQFVVQLLQIRFLPAAGADVPNGFQPLLDAVGHGPFGQDIRGAKAVLQLFGARRQEHRNGNHPQHSKRHPPIPQKHAHPDEKGGKNRGEKLRDIMGKHLIQTGTVRNHGGGQIAQIPVPEKGKGELPQRLRQGYPPAGALLIGGEIQRRILKPVQNEQQHKHRSRRSRIQPEPVHGLSAPFRKLQQILYRRHGDAHRKHQADVAQKAPDHRLYQILCALLTQGKQMLKSLCHTLLLSNLPAGALLVIRPHAGINAACGKKRSVRTPFRDTAV